MQEDIWGKEEFMKKEYYHFQSLVAYQALQLVQNWTTNSYEIRKAKN